jgi:hypothetical protein
MKLLEQWERRRREIQQALSDELMEPSAAARELAHLDYRIKRRPLILKHCRYPRAWRKPQAERLHDALAKDRG